MITWGSAGLRMCGRLQLPCVSQVPSLVTLLLSPQVWKQSTCPRNPAAAIPERRLCDQQAAPAPQGLPCLCSALARGCGEGSLLWSLWTQVTRKQFAVLPLLTLSSSLAPPPWDLSLPEGRLQHLALVDLVSPDFTSLVPKRILSWSLATSRCRINTLL